MEAPLAPDAVDWAVSALNPKLTPPVGGRVPNSADSWVRVQRTGGGDGSRVSDLPQLTFECYAGDDAAAAQLANLVRAHLQGLVGKTTAGVYCYRVNAAGISDRPDPRTPDHSRYAFTAEIHLRSAIMEV